MGFVESVHQDTTLEKQIFQNEKKENNFLSSNPDIKKIGENIKSQYSNFDIDNFGNLAQKLLEDASIKKEDLNNYLEYILKGYLALNQNFIFDLNEEDIVYRIKSEIIKFKATENKSKVEENKNNKKLERKKDIKTYRENQIHLYKSIPDKFKINKDSKESQEFKEKNLARIQDKLIGTGIPVDEYLTNRYTAQKLSEFGENNTTKYEFIKSFNQLNKLLDIDIQIPLFTDRPINYKPLPDSLDDFQSKPEKILALDSVQNYIDSSTDILNDKDITISDSDIIKLYSDKIPDAIAEIISKNNLDPSLIKYFDIQNYNTKTGILNKDTIKAIQDYKLLNQLQQISQAVSERFIKQGKEEILIITNKSIKEKIMSSIFRGISDFFDITNKNIENFSSDFKLDFNQDLNLENNIINIKGQINGSYIGLHYDLINGKLSMDNVVAFDPENKIYNISKKTGTFSDVPIKLPKLADFYDDARKFDYKYISKKSTNIDQYQDTLDKQLGLVFYGNFVHRELNQYYIRRLNEKNLAVQSAINYTFANRSFATGSDNSFDISQGIQLKQDLNPGHFEFAKIIDDTFQYYNKSDNLLKIRNLFEKFDMLINSKNIKDGNSNENLINKLFSSKQMLISANSWKYMGASDDFNYLKFYRLISKSRGDNQIIDLDILDRVVSILAKSESFSDPANKRKFNGDFWDKYEKIISDPNKILEKI